MIIVDSGPLFAAADRHDPHHQACLGLLETMPDPIVVPSLVVTEVAYLIGSRLGAQAEAQFAHSLGRGELLVECPTPADWGRIAELCASYADLALGIVDGSVIAVAERLDVGEIATLDHRHFSVVRPRHRPSFTLLPAPARG